MNKKPFSFQKQLKFGKNGESLFCEYYHKENAKNVNCREFDCYINGNEKCEIKTDSYSMDKTENMFIEKIGNDQNNKPGGPFLSVLHDIKYFVYYYINDNTFFWFKPQDLVDYIDKNMHKLKEKKIFNYGYSSIGYLIKRDDISHLIIRKDKF